MKTHTPEAMRAYFSRVAPFVPELFNMAHAICGNYDLAEYALLYALVEAWVGESHGGMGFREGIRNTLRTIALEEALEPRSELPEYTWNGLCRESDDPMLQILAQEAPEIRRMAALRYGCGFADGRIARVMGVTTGRVREQMDRFERRGMRKLPPAERRRFDVQMGRVVRREFSTPGVGIPSVNAVYRAFESEASETHRPKHIAVRLLRRAACAVLILMCALVFWVGAVLLSPSMPAERIAAADNTPVAGMEQTSETPE